MVFKVPSRLAVACRQTPERAAWLERLPKALRSLKEQWSLRCGNPFDNEDVSCAWVAPVLCSDGSAAILKLGMPHMEGRDEAHALRVWDGDGAVRLLAADDEFGAMLLERCEPGTPLRGLEESGQDVVIAGLLRRLWQRRPEANGSFRALSALTDYWSEETLADTGQWPDAGLVRQGLALFEQLSRGGTGVLLATDLHAGNVLRSQREPWLVIDPKPFVGDPAYDATQHLLNCEARLRSDPSGTIRRMADLLEVDHERVRLWLFARVAAEPLADWGSEDAVALARAIAP